MIKIILFDFDGTLADTKKVWMSSIIKILKKEKFYCPECEARVIIHFGKKIKDVLSFLDIPKVRVLDIQNKIYKEFSKHKLKRTADFSFLEDIKARKYILSNSPTHIIRKVLGKNIRYFDRIYGADKFDDKVNFIKRLKKINNLSSKQIAYIGDRAGDAIISKNAGCLSVVISNKYSWNSSREIIKEEPDVVLSKILYIKKLF